MITGVIQALGTSWGLLRHYWGLVKVITLLATAVLLVHMQPVSYLAGLAAGSDLVGAYGSLQIQVLADVVAAAVVLLIAIGLSVFKPRGLTRYGWRRQYQRRDRGNLTQRRGLDGVGWVAKLGAGVTGSEG